MPTTLTLLVDVPPQLAELRKLQRENARLAVENRVIKREHARLLTAIRNDVKREITDLRKDLLAQHNELRKALAQIRTK